MAVLPARPVRLRIGVAAAAFALGPAAAAAFATPAVDDEHEGAATQPAPVGPEDRSGVADRGEPQEQAHTVVPTRRGRRRASRQAVDVPALPGELHAEPGQADADPPVEAGGESVRRLDGGGPSAPRSGGDGPSTPASGGDGPSTPASGGDAQRVPAPPVPPRPVTPPQPPPVALGPRPAAPGAPQVPAPPRRAAPSPAPSAGGRPAVSPRPAPERRPARSVADRGAAPFATARPAPAPLPAARPVPVAVPVARPAPPPPAPPAAPARASTYVVRAGDTLWSIAQRRLGGRAGAAAIAREVARIWAANGAAIGTGDADLIKVGTVLRLAA